MTIGLRRPTKKQAISEQLAIDTVAFLAKGGTVTYCDNNTSLCADNDYLPIKDKPKDKDYLRHRMSMETKETLIRQTNNRNPHNLLQALDREKELNL